MISFRDEFQHPLINHFFTEKVKQSKKENEVVLNWAVLDLRCSEVALLLNYFFLVAN